MITVKTGIGAAASAALIAIAAINAAPAVAESGKDAKVHCYGVNSCKGSSDCKTAEHACKGQNDCKGHGFKEMTAEACTAAGGTTTEAKK